MIVFDLMLTVCLASNASYCRTEHIYVQDHASQMHCMLHAQTHIARWMDSHPGFRVIRWECVNPDLERRI